jgi:hypothetical protein
MYRDEQLRQELCYMCLTHRPLRPVYHTSPNRKEIHVCVRCIQMNGHEVVNKGQQG